MFSISTTSGISFPQIEQDTILNAAEKSGFNLAYSCRSGRCSTCKCKVISGDTVPLVDELGLTRKEKEEGWILSCARSAISDLNVQIDDLGDLMIPRPAVFPCRINSIDRLSAGVVSVVLRLPPTSNFNILPGQYVDIIGPSGSRRSYSVANHVASNILEFHIGEVEEGHLSDYWFRKAKVNDFLRINGPLGTFVLRSIKDKDVIFLATGTGIAPIKAMIESVTCLPSEERPNSMTVFWGGRTQDDLYFDPSVDCTLLRYVPVLSRSTVCWTGQKGYVQDVFLNEQSNLSNCVVYACGSENMIRSSHELLVKSGLPENNFFSDAFVTSGPT